ncbi:hypothetical protein SLA2020_222080 [Shorea laevis]
MSQEEHSQKCSTSAGSGGGVGIRNFGRSFKRQKPKKVPQRGLGVAQLEKIRLEEQQKKDGVVAAAAAILPSPSPTTISPSQKSSYLSLPIPAFHHPPNRSSSTPSIPFPGSHAPANSIFIPDPSAEDIDIPLPNSPLGWPPGAVPGHGNVNVQKFWSVREYDLEKENSGVDPGLAFKANFRLPYESEPIWPPPNLMQRAQQYKQHSSAVVNASSTSTPSLLNIQMEPPSNQNFYGNCTIFWSGEEKKAGKKRPYSFSLDNPVAPSVHYKYAPITHAINRSDEQEASSGNGNTMNFGSINPIFREGPPCSTSNLELNLKKSSKENDVFNGDFLTLAPPSSTSVSPSSISKHPPLNLRLYNFKFPDFESLPYQQGCMEDSSIRLGLAGGLNPQRPYHSFFPSSMVQIGQASTFNGGAEVGESVDLNLKL